MLRLLGNIPKEVAIAVSGGPDSMAVLDFCLKGKRKVTALYFNHGTKHGAEAEVFVRDYCNKNSIELKIGGITRNKLPEESPEEYWRLMRYSFFSDVGKIILLAHHLDDQVEQYIFSTLRGNTKLIPYCRMEGESIILRPFLLVTKNDLLDWCIRKNIPYVLDLSNNDTKYSRNFIRHKIVPLCFEVNKGLYKTVRKKTLEEYNKLNVK